MAESDTESVGSVEHLRGDLRRRSIKGGTAMMIAAVWRFAVNVVSTAVLARLLTPDDFGLMAMAVTVTRFLSTFKDAGLEWATVQRSGVDESQVSTLFWINVVFGAAIMLFAILVAPAVGWFYGDSRLSGMVTVLAIGFVASGFSVQHQALLQRQMRFSFLAQLEMVSVLVGVGAAILMAYKGLGVWALIGKELLPLVAVVPGVWMACHWRTSAPGRVNEVRSMLSFGANSVGVRVTGYFTRNFDNVLIGWRLGPGPLGIYNMAYHLMYLPIQQINSPVSRVAVGVLSRLQNEPEQYRRYYRTGLMLVLALGMPIAALMFVTADKIVLALLGPQWIEVTPVFRMFGPAVFLSSLNVATGWIYLSLGRTDRQLRWQVFASIIMVICFIIGLHWGTIGVAAGFSIGTVVLLFPGIGYCYRGTMMEMSDVTKTMWRPALAAVVSGLTTYGYGLALGTTRNVVYGLVMEIGLYVTVYIGVWMVLPGGWQWIRTVRRFSRELTTTRWESPAVEVSDS